MSRFALNSDRIKLGHHIWFSKGKTIIERGPGIAMPYLNLDYLTGVSNSINSYDGIMASKVDTLMLMDGASSGLVFSGFVGYAGSTIAIVHHDKTIDPYVLFAVLRENQNVVKERATGSAIPHADKRLIEEIEYPLLSSTDNVMIQALLEKEWSLRNSSKALNRAKNILLNKYF